MHGAFTQATQKHIEWKSNRCMSFGPDRIMIAMSEMFLFNSGNGTYDGIAIFDLADFQALSAKFHDYTEKKILPYLKPTYTEHQKAFIISSTLIKALGASFRLNETSYLAAYLTGFHYFPDFQKEKKTGGKTAKKGEKAA